MSSRTLKHVCQSAGKSLTMSSRERPRRRSLMAKQLKRKNLHLNSNFFLYFLPTCSVGKPKWKQSSWEDKSRTSTYLDSRILHWLLTRFFSKSSRISLIYFDTWDNEIGFHKLMFKINVWWPLTLQTLNTLLNCKYFYVQSIQDVTFK